MHNAAGMQVAVAVTNPTFADSPLEEVRIRRLEVVDKGVNGAAQFARENLLRKHRGLDEMFVPVSANCGEGSELVHADRLSPRRRGSRQVHSRVGA
jgi:hypothetical protein